MMHSIEYLGVFVAILLFFFIRLWRCNRNNPNPHWPIVGMIVGLLRNLSNFHDYVTITLKYYGGTYMFRGPWLANINYVITSDPMNVHHITSRNFGNYGKGSEFHENFEALGDGIFNSDSHKWKRSRALLHSIFKDNNFESFLIKVIHKKLESCLIPNLAEASKAAGTQVDLQEIFQRFTFDTICSLVLGFDPNCLPSASAEFSEVACEKAFSKMEDGIFYRHIVPRRLWKLQKWFQVGQEKTLTESVSILDKFLHESISSRREARNCVKEAADESNFDMLNALQARGTERVDDKFMRDTATNLLLAGKDTISVGLSWFFWLVSTHPHVEAKILEEIRDKCVTKEGNSLTSSVEDLNKLVYLHGAICEVLRLYPPLPLEHKCAIKSDILPSGERINPNTMILYSLYAMGRMEHIWGEDCMEFKPERWISEKGNNIHVPSYKFIAFNAGPRNCLGKNFSFIQMKMVAIALLWNFHIQVVEGHPVSPCVSIILHMKHGLKVRVTKRCT